MEYTTSKTFLDGINSKGYSREVTDGGFSSFALSYMTSGYGPILENTMPFKNTTSKINLSEIDKEAVKSLKSFARFSSIYKTVKDGATTYKDNKGEILTDTQVNNIRNQVKEHIMANGAVSVDLYIDNKNFNTGNLKTGTAYYCDTVNNNHQVTIVGWDDTYSRNNFASSCRPTKDGAWLVQNSWGTSYNDGGYFYVSYEDVNIEDDMTGIISVEDIEYDNIYQYDILSANKEVTISTRSNKHAQIANVFTRKETKSEKITEIGITSTGEAVTADIYINIQGALNLTNATKIASNIKLTPGYMTVKCNIPVLVTNNKFAIIVKYNSNIVKVPMEATDSYWHKTATANEGEGFYGDENGFLDITRISPNGSMCLKAFTVIEDIKEPEIEGGDIKSEKYIINKNPLYIGKIFPETSIETFKKQFNISENKVHVYKDLKMEEEVKTGYVKSYMIVKFDEFDEKYVAVVTGDINGDGEANQIELHNIITHILGLKDSKLTGMKLICGDMNNDGKVTQLDLKLLINYILYKRIEI